MNREKLKKRKKEIKKLTELVVSAIPLLAMLYGIKVAINRFDYCFFDFGYKRIEEGEIPDL